MSDFVQKKIDQVAFFNYIKQVLLDIFMIIDEEKVRKIFKEISDVNKRMENV